MPILMGGRHTKPTLSTSNSKNAGHVLVVCVSLSLVLFTMSASMGQDCPLEYARGAFQTITSPVVTFGSVVAAPFKGLGNVIANLTASQETLTELTEENARLTAENVELKEYQETAERLESLFDLRNTNNLQSVAANVISGSTDSWTSTVTIDKGTASGLEVGMPITSAAGVVGQIIDCGLVTSTVRLLTDENSSISAMTQSGRVHGMLVGSVTGQLTLTLVGATQEVEVGDIVVTSGLGGVFPKGLPIGKVTSVTNNPGAVYQDIVVEPYASSSNFEEVLVITSLTEEQRADADDITSADAQDAIGATSGEDAEGAEGAGEATSEDESQ